MEKQNNNNKKKKLYSRLVLVTSLFPIEIIKHEKLKKKKVPKEMHRQTVVRTQLTKSPEGVTHLLSPSMMRGLFCHQITKNEASEGHQMHN